MIVPVFTQEEFLSYLKDHGCTIVSTEHWDELDTILLEKDGETFSMFLQPKYFYVVVVDKCESIGIKPPPDHLHVYYQHYRRNEPCHCGSGKPFLDCHGKAD